MPKPGDLAAGIQFPTLESAVSTANTDLTTATITDITGCTVTFDVAEDCTALAIAVADIDCTAFGASTVGSVRITLDGVVMATAGAQFNSGNDRQTPVAMIPLTLTAGSHTVKMQGNNTAASGTLRYLISNCSLAVLILAT